MKRPHHTALLCSLLMVATVSTAGAQGLQAPVGVDEWRVETVGGMTCVEGSREASRSCLPEGVPQLSDLVSTSMGWSAATATRDESGRDILVLINPGTGIEALPSPRGREASRGRPQLVSDGLSLLGVVWLEGERQSELRIMAAEWLGSDWGPTHLVSDNDDGSQVAPAVTVLEDGRWLLTWTAFDGEDDETVWSLYDGHRWSSTERLHEDNAVPDTTPAVLATRTGAVAAWNSFDGSDYRLRIADFDGRTWRLAEALPGRGAGAPVLLNRQGATLLVYSTVEPREWVGLGLGPRGEIRNRMAVERDTYEVPRVDYIDGEIRLIWASEPGAASDRTLKDER